MKNEWRSQENQTTKHKAEIIITNALKSQTKGH